MLPHIEFWPFLGPPPRSVTLFDLLKSPKSPKHPNTQTPRHLNKTPKHLNTKHLNTCRVFVKTSPAEGRRRFHKKTRTFVVCPTASLSFFVVLFVCLGFPPCVVFFVFFCSAPWQFSLALLLRPGRSKTGAQKCPNFFMKSKHRENKEAQNSIWGKTGHL